MSLSNLILRFSLIVSVRRFERLFLFSLVTITYEIRGPVHTLDCRRALKLDRRIKLTL